MLVGRIAAERQVVHQHVLVDEESQSLGLVRRDAQPLDGVRSDPQPHFPMIFQVSLAQIVEQQRQVQQVLLGQWAVDSAQRPPVGPKVRGELDSAQTMFVHRVLVVLVELQQPPGVTKLGNESLQEVGVVQIAQERPQPRGMTEQRKEVPASFRRRQGPRQMTDVATNGFPRGGRNRLVVEIGQVDHPHDGGQIAAERFEAVPRGENARRTDLDSVLDPVTKQHRDQPRHAVA